VTHIRSSVGIPFLSLSRRRLVSEGCDQTVISTKDRTVSKDAEGFHPASTTAAIPLASTARRGAPIVWTVWRLR